MKTELDILTVLASRGLSDEDPDDAGVADVDGDDEEEDEDDKDDEAGDTVAEEI